MMSSSDLPACPACGSREVRTVKDPPQTWYKCAQCGRDRTKAWEDVQPKPPPEKADVSLAASFDQEAKDRHFEEDQETITEAAMRLGIAATLRVVS